MFREFLGKLQKRLFPFDRKNNDEGFEEDLDFSPRAPIPIPEDVQEGHFAVLATNGSEKKRFVVKVEWASSPEFMRLLEQAEQEYGFEQTGALLIPCSPQELQKIINSAGSRRRSLEIRVGQIKQFLKERFPNLRLDTDPSRFDDDDGHVINL